MKRRQVLATVGVGLSTLAGCLEGGAGRPAGGDERRGPGSDDQPSTPTPTDDCGTAGIPLSGWLVNHGGGGSACYDGATPSLVVENEREVMVEVEVEIESTSVVSESPDVDGIYALGPGERVVESSALAAHTSHQVEVTVDGTETATGSWDGVSCYRHGVAITPDGIEVGLVPPRTGPGDTQHDCYAGDEAPIRLYNAVDEPWTIDLLVVDHCTNSSVEEVVDLEPEGFEFLGDLLVSGGVFDVTLDVNGGGSETYEFHDECWGLEAGILEDGSVEISQLMID